nr:PREDICTED: uncharacterized protein LOC109042990 isoform X3 [Bemisia tabaci]XP_018915545.1 PREDICTED: uncharacterized protein LOC109042990 isoform X3 [Bemisia tabaci]XP_018915546.1 PREDICTED: uncharacterized protein LOC109042990 isoform X3 [Bemisia tabaci]XP_018915547.1 PREDICTED: uncharacterized protein LOC109042990 isoform X3 [Bemisia tabaci]
MLDPSFGQNAPSDILELPLNSPIPTSPVFPSSALRPSYGQNPPSPQITPYSGYIQGGEGSAAPSSPPRSSSGVRRSPSGGEGGAPDTVDWRCPECGKSYHNKETIYAHKYNHFAVRKGYTTCRRCRKVHPLSKYPWAVMSATFAEILSVLPAISKGTCRATQERRSVPYAGHLIHRRLIRPSIWQNTTRVLGIPKIGICKELEDFGIGKTRSTYIKNHLI